MPTRLTQAPPCANAAEHTVAPEAYLAWHAWAEGMSQTHQQVRCRRCGLFVIWVPKPPRPPRPTKAAIARVLRSLTPVVLAVIAIGCEPDRGRCLAPRVVPHHTDGYFGLALDGDGDLTVTWVDAEDWNVTVCDRWEFPNGRAEKEDPHDAR